MAFSPDDLAPVVAAYEAAGRKLRPAARALGMARTTFRRRLEAAASLGLLGTRPVLPGFVLTRTSAELDEDGAVRREWVQQERAPGEVFEVPGGHVVKGVSAYVDPDGRIVGQWIKTREGMEPLDVVAALKAGLEGYEGPPAGAWPPAPADVAADLLNLLPLGDLHFGLYSWRLDAQRNWDLRLAEATYDATVDKVLAGTPPAGQMVVLIGGDLVHADNNLNRTNRSGHALDVDGRYPKVVEAAARMIVRTIDKALAISGQVLVRVLAGNHDEHTSVAIAHFLLAWYRHEPRVEVDTDPSLFWWLRFGSTFLGATHGHTIRPRDMPAVMAARRPQDWGASRHRYIHTFHRHHKELLASEAGGAIVEVHRAPAPQDAWHFGAGFLSGAAMQTITYHREGGEEGRSIRAILHDMEGQAA